MSPIQLSFLQCSTPLNTPPASIHRADEIPRPRFLRTRPLSPRPALCWADPDSRLRSAITVLAVSVYPCHLPDSLNPWLSGSPPSLHPGTLADLSSSSCPHCFVMFCLAVSTLNSELLEFRNITFSLAPIQSRWLKVSTLKKRLPLSCFAELGMPYLSGICVIFA